MKKLVLLEVEKIKVEIAALLIISFAILISFAKIVPYFTFDLVITKIIQQIDFPGFFILMEFISEMGNFFWGSILIMAFSILAIAFGKYKDAVMIFTSGVGAGILSTFLKEVVDRPRPDPSLITQIGDYAKFDSFPSGHVLHFIGLYGFLIILSFVYLKSWIIKIIILVVLITLIILAGLSRIYLGAHWFSDTLGAYLIGAVWLFFMEWVYRKFVPSKDA